MVAVHEAVGLTERWPPASAFRPPFVRTELIVTLQISALDAPVLAIPYLKISIQQRIPKGHSLRYIPITLVVSLQPVCNPVN